MEKTSARSAASVAGRNVENPVVLFDGVCNLCSGAVRFILSFEKSDELRFASLQSEFGVSVLNAFELDPSVTDSIVFVRNGNVFVKSDAALKIAEYLKFPFNLLRVLTVSPKRVRDTIYDLIARHRYRFFGKKNECWLPHPKWEKRFIKGNENLPIP